MKAIFAGTVAGGFSIARVFNDPELAEQFVIANLANGVLAEAVEVLAPSLLDASIDAVPSGSYFVSYGQGIEGGFMVYGPFDDYELALEFAEDNRKSDDEWEILELHDQVDLDDVAEWVGLHYQVNFAAEPADKQGDWIERYKDLHAQATQLLNNQ